MQNQTMENGEISAYNNLKSREKDNRLEKNG